MTGEARFTRAGGLIAARLLEHEPVMLSTLRELVGIASHASHPAGVAGVAGLMAGRLSALGLSCMTSAAPPLPEDLRWLAPVIFPEASYDDIADPVVARGEGVPGAPRVLLLGDLDTSYTGRAAAGFSFEIRGDRAYGPGVADMKGGLVTLLGALWALRETGLAMPPVTVVLSPDEQAGSLRSRPVIEREAAGCGLCFCLECARDGGKLMRSRAAAGVGLLEVFGAESHAGTARAAGVSAVRALSGLIPAIEDLTDPGHGDYVTVGIVSGGRRRSVVPGYASCIVDVRADTTARWQRLSERIADLAERLDPPARAVWRGANHRPAVEQTPASAELLALVERAGSVLDIPVAATGSAAAGSSAFAGFAGLPTIDGLGAPGGHLMTDREYIEWPGLRERAGLLALSLHMLAVPQAAECR
jgi:glutamate carboxypeptidase